MAPLHRIFSILAAAIFFHCSASGCRWRPDPPIWSKNPKSDAALFRVVLDGKAGYINVKGEVVIEPQFNPFYLDVGYGDFINGFARVLTDKGEFVIDESGKIVSKYRSSDSPIVGSLGHPREGLVPFAEDVIPDRSKPPVPRVGLKGYRNMARQVVISPRFAYAGPFSEGLAAVAIDGNCWVSGYRGMHFPAPSAETIQTSCGPQPAREVVNPCPHAYIDSTGRFVTEAAYELAREFSEGRAAVRRGGLWGFIDSAGRHITGFHYEAVKGFSENRAAVMIGGRWTYIDREGAVVIPPQYADALSFSQGLAAVKREDRYFFIDSSGREVLPGPYLLATQFVQGLAHVKLGAKKWAWIDRTGKPVFIYEWDQSSIE